MPQMIENLVLRAAAHIRKEGRRYYLQGLPYEQRDRAKRLGCKWDPAKKCWWTGKLETAETLARAVTSSAEGERQAPGRDQTVAGSAQYKGRSYYIAGRVERGRTHYDDSVDAITTRDGGKLLLCFRDGSKTFWAPRSEVSVTKRYGRPCTIAGLQRFAQRARREGLSGGSGQEYCYHRCPVGGFKCCPENGPCHDCE